MVMPKLPFSLFDFKLIQKIEPILWEKISGAGVAIPVTIIYTVPEHHFVWLLGINVTVTKITGTLMYYAIVRKKGGADMLIYESAADTGQYAWPSAKTPSLQTPAWFPLFLFEGDTIKVSHALTAAETIAHSTMIHRIEYKDPRYEED